MTPTSPGTDAPCSCPLQTSRSTMSATVQVAVDTVLQFERLANDRRIDNLHKAVLALQATIEFPNCDCGVDSRHAERPAHPRVPPEWARSSNGRPCRLNSRGEDRLPVTRFAMHGAVRKNELRCPLSGCFGVFIDKVIRKSIESRLLRSIERPEPPIPPTPNCSQYHHESNPLRCRFSRLRLAGPR